MEKYNNYNTKLVNEQERNRLLLLSTQNISGFYFIFFSKEKKSKPVVIQPPRATFLHFEGFMRSVYCIVIPSVKTIYKRI